MMDTSYTAHVSQAENRIPVFRDIIVRNVLVDGPGTVTLDGNDPEHRVGIQFDNVVFTDPSRIKIKARNSDVKIGPGAFNLNIKGQNVNVTGTPGQSPKMSCAGRFVDFPTQR
jgi:trimethylamine:corrinoid methyltransferase-like protein